LNPLKRKNVYCGSVTCTHSNIHYTTWVYQHSFKTPWYFEFIRNSTQLLYIQSCTTQQQLGQRRTAYTTVVP
jgi:hypothetical protein